jgi:TetR/AcrR family transcriptional regulator
MKQSNTKSTQRERSDQTRKAILDAAIREFSVHGLSGARTDAIAESAGANKALLYYYFKSKENLYTAAIEEVSGKVLANAMAALDPAYSAGERLLRTALNHFDRVLSQQEFQSLLQQEMVRFHRHKSADMPAMFQLAFKPLVEKIEAAVKEGVRSRELCRVDPLQVMCSAFGANVFYFLSAPMMQLALPYPLFAPETLRLRRQAAVHFLGNAIFEDRAYGARLAKRVLKQMPMPEIKDFQFRRKQI